MLKWLRRVLGLPPRHLVQAKRAVDARSEYVYYTGWVKPAGLKENQGNCAWYALQYSAELERMGYSAPWLKECRLPDGTGHAVLDVDGWRLDVRERTVIPASLSVCK